VEINHSPSGKASVLSNNPFVGLQAAVSCEIAWLTMGQYLPDEI
jgi:hypothetical protein